LGLCVTWIMRLKPRGHWSNYAQFVPLLTNPQVGGDWVGLGWATIVLTWTRSPHIDVSSDTTFCNNMGVFPRRSQYACGLRFEMLSLVQTLGFWVRVSLQTLIYALSFCFMFVWPSEGSSRLAVWPSSQGVLPTAYNAHNFRLIKNWNRPNCLIHLQEEKKNKHKHVTCIGLLL
jgi:hypothetical protein